MNEQDHTLLDQYFNGLLPPEEARRVRERAASESEFAAEFSLRQQMEDFPRRQAQREALTHTLNTLGAAYFSENKKAENIAPVRVAYVNRRRWMAIAASLALVAVAAWFLLRPSPSLYDQYADHGPLAFTERGQENDALAQQAEQAFNAGDYSGAYAALAELLSKEPDNAVARLYAGISLLELRRPAEARTTLAPLAGGTTALRADGVWFSALAYVQEADWRNAREMLKGLKEGDDHYDEAQDLGKKLERR